MSKLSPVSYAELVERLRLLGFDGPYMGGKHPYMLKDNISLTIPSPHSKVIGIDLLSRILKQAGIDKDDWLNIKK